jgi:hypothetical protein
MGMTGRACAAGGLERDPNVSKCCRQRLCEPIILNKDRYVRPHQGYYTLHSFAFQFVQISIYQFYRIILFPSNDTLDCDGI